MLMQKMPGIYGQSSQEKKDYGAVEKKLENKRRSSLLLGSENILALFEKEC